MATFRQLYVNFFTGVGVATLSLFLFGLALRFGYHAEIAPRSWSRPRGILKNVLKAPFGITWMFWSWKQTYPNLMAGIPGTGTRQGGWAGPLLKVDLDGIIMIKYHVLLSKVALVATILCLVVILPVNMTAKCDVELLGIGTCEHILHNLTDFERTTIANIPPLEYNGTHAAFGSRPFLNEFWVRNISSRYFVIALVAWVIYWYICHLLWYEWVENLALRRLFFLEHDHYGERKDEWAQLDALNENHIPPDRKKRPPWLPHPELRETVPSVSLYSCLYQLPQRIVTTNLPDSASGLERQLAASVDFFDQCVPNQWGFSSSVVAVTILPEPAHVALAWKKWYQCTNKLRKLRYIRQHIQRHLDRRQAEEEEWVATEDLTGKVDEESKHEIPIEASNRTLEDMASTWPLEKIREPALTMETTPSLDLESGGAITENDSSALLKSPERSDGVLPHRTGLSLIDDLMDKVVRKKEQDSYAGKENFPHSKSMPEVPQPDGKIQVTDEVHDSSYCASSNRRTDLTMDTTQSEEVPNHPLSFRYTTFQVNSLAREIGFEEETQLDNLVADIGIEQLSVYAREYAQSSSNACPYGCGEEIIRFSRLEKLREMEKKAMEQVNEANTELMEAREAVNRLTSGIHEPEKYTVVDNYDPGASKKDDGSTEDPERGATATNSRVSRIRKRLAAAPRIKWQQAQAIANSTTTHRTAAAPSGCTGVFAKGRKAVVTQTVNITRFADQKTKKSLKKVVNILEHPTFAVVTFTSRQAAVAARQCMSDGGGLNRWVEIGELPVPPLADAPPCNIMFCRGCCRPITLTISEREKKLRRGLGVTTFLLFCFFYTIPLALTSQLLNPTKLATVFPNLEALRKPQSFFFQVVSGISSGILYSLFFSFCPQLFNAIANFEGNVSSKRTAEDKALTYYWFFMMLTAFTGTTLTQMLTEVFINRKSLGGQIRLVLAGVANSIPTQQAPVWMNWLIVRFTYTLPLMYLFRASTFAFRILPWPCCSRRTQGGGPGGPRPFRFFVDSGTAHMCVVAIAPVCPLMAPVALLYFAVILIMMPWLLVFVYRPYYDAGGSKWPALHEIIISSTIFGQILLTTIMALRNAIFPAFMVLLTILPTYWFSENCKQHFLRAYNDAGLLQTSRLDGWDASIPTSLSQREEYRRWLVDCHKASYVPICLAGSESLSTVEPAIVVPTKRDNQESRRSHFVSQKSQRGRRLNRFDPEEEECSVHSGHSI